MKMSRDMIPDNKHLDSGHRERHAYKHTLKHAFSGVNKGRVSHALHNGDD